jgi:hypothetical protein
MISELFHTSAQGFFMLDFIGVDDAVKDAFLVVDGGEDVVFQLLNDYFFKELIRIKVTIASYIREEMNFQVVEEVRVNSENFGLFIFAVGFYFVSGGISGALVAFVEFGRYFVHGVIGRFDFF